MGQESVHKLDVIKANSNHVTQHCSEMFTLWRQRQPNANWNQLLRALLDVKLNALANELDKLLLTSKEEEEEEEQQQQQQQQQHLQPQHIKQVQGNHKMQESDEGKYIATYM